MPCHHACMRANIELVYVILQNNTKSTWQCDARDLLDGFHVKTHDQ